MLVDLLVNVMAFCVLIFSIIVHEIAHGYIADYCGDDTARQSGRLSLNPLRHIDPAGTILIPLLLRLIKSPVIFGWAKPVPINPSRLRDPQKHMLWVSIAGPLSNILLGLVFIIVGRLLLLLTNFALPDAVSVLVALSITVVGLGVLYNFFLAFFNLIPIPPLDGSRVLRYFMPSSVQVIMDKIEPYGFLILFLALYYFKDLFNYLYNFVIYLAGLLMY